MPTVRKRPTIADVADACGVSKGTVSLALNYPLEKSRLRPETQQKVMEAAKRLGYRPSRRGRSLASGKTFDVGVLFTEGSFGHGEADPAWISALAASLQESGYHALLCATSGEQDTWRDILFEQRVDGVIALGSVSDSVRVACQESGVPSVEVALRRRPDDANEAIVVLADPMDGLADCAEHVRGAGSETIVLIDEADEREDAALDLAGVERAADVDEALRRVSGADRPVGVIARSRETAAAVLSGLGGAEAGSVTVAAVLAGDDVALRAAGVHVVAPCARAVADLATAAVLKAMKGGSAPTNGSADLGPSRVPFELFPGRSLAQSVSSARARVVSS